MGSTLRRGVWTGLVYGASFFCVELLGTAILLKWLGAGAGILGVLWRDLLALGMEYCAFGVLLGIVLAPPVSVVERRWLRRFAGPGLNFMALALACVALAYLWNPESILPRRAYVLSAFGAQALILGVAVLGLCARKLLSLRLSGAVGRAFASVPGLVAAVLLAGLAAYGALRLPTSTQRGVPTGGGHGRPQRRAHRGRHASTRPCFRLWLRTNHHAESRRDRCAGCAVRERLHDRLVDAAGTRLAVHGPLHLVARDRQRRHAAGGVQDHDRGDSCRGWLQDRGVFSQPLAQQNERTRPGLSNVRLPGHPDNDKRLLPEPGQGPLLACTREGRPGRPWSGNDYRPPPGLDSPGSCRERPVLRVRELHGGARAVRSGARALLLDLPPPAGAAGHRSPMGSGDAAVPLLQLLTGLRQRSAVS